ncbi:S8 family serine peptidase [Winogradskyella bathintestinalis]|uniref:S8 family serine peptidase n=1 Tax=Winogradskyella bathintestinalis TaxID=3035208 RepID=A0ABT7ZU06_9FLAO|nr:S8 family serine peptidase [Winogradskyella bathintestinalis]MDN3492475.1 S8 family serine peptidase [Winogradskyella bathintestinalis]
MKKPIASLLFFLVINIAFAQEDAWVYLTDKPNVTASIANPISILSQKAIDRKQNHNVAIDERDVPVNESYISDLKNQSGIVVMAKSKWFNAIHVRGLEADISALINLDYVEYIDFANNNLNILSRGIANINKNHIEEETITFTYGETLNQVEMINADNLHDADYTGEGITIAVMDSGFPNVDTMGAFQRLRNNNNLLNGYDFVDRTTDVYAFTGSSHGTKVLSTMAGFVENQFVGTAPDAAYYLFRTEDSSAENPVEESYWVEAAERADSLGVDIINTSLGYTVFDNPNYNYTPADMNGQVAFITKGASIAAEKGILVVVSAGNSGSSSWQTVGAPADSPNVLSIAAVDADENYVAFSSQGSDAQVGYVKPDVAAKGGATSVVNQLNNIVQNNGTSFSAPVMCGGIASLWQAIPEASPTDIMDFVRQSASQFTTPDYFLGYGIPDLDLARTMALSIPEVLIEDFNIQPNPVRHELNLSIPSSVHRAEIVIYNQLGQLILNQTITEQSNIINVLDLAPGLYLLKISANKYSRTFKFIRSSN